MNMRALALHWLITIGCVAAVLYMWREEGKS